MKNLLTFNINKCWDAYEASIANKIPFNLSNYYTKTAFLPHCLALFATIPLKRNEEGLISMRQTVEALTLDKHKTFDGTINTKNLKDLILFTSKANRSVIMPTSATKDPTLGGITPLFMYAHKLYDNVQYTEWDKYDDYIGIALGKFLAGNWEFVRKGNTKPNLTHELVDQLRSLLMEYKSGKKAGLPVSPLIYKMRKYMIGDTVYPANVLIMELQTWVANVQLRNTDTMILDLWDWSNVPKAWDTKVEIVPEVKQVISRDIWT